MLIVQVCYGAALLLTAQDCTVPVLLHTVLLTVQTSCLLITAAEVQN